MAVNQLLSAWDARFTKGQLQDIKNMSLHAERSGMKLHDLIDTSPPETSGRVINRKVLRQSPKICPECGRRMQLYAVNMDPRGTDRVGSTDYENADDRQFKSMWLCGKSCNGTGCWYEEYNYYSIEEYKKGGIK